MEEEGGGRGIRTATDVSQERYTARGGTAVAVGRGGETRKEKKDELTV